MGWCSDYTYWSKRDTNKDILLRTRPSWRPLVERGELKLSQKGSNVYVLEKTANGYSWVYCYLCKWEGAEEWYTTNCRLSSGTFKYGISNLKVIR